MPYFLVAVCDYSPFCADHNLCPLVQEDGEEMSGWKTKTGSILTAVGGVLATAANGCPVPDWSPWLQYLGGVIASIGVALMGYGIGHKIEKGQQ